MEKLGTTSSKKGDRGDGSKLGGAGGAVGGREEGGELSGLEIIGVH
jgi:hypothetical protein